MDGLSVILPVFNQAGGLQKALSEWRDALEKLKRPFEIIVINDGSTDSTSGLLATMQANQKFDSLKVHEFPTRQGYGAGLRRGFEIATQPLLFVTALDYPYAPSDTKTLFPALNQKNEFTRQSVSLVTGCRLDQPFLGGRALRTNIQRYATRVFFGHLPEKPIGFCSHSTFGQRLGLRMQFGLRFQDTFSAFKLFRREVIERIEFQSNSRFILAELLAKASFLGHLMDEVPIALHPGPIPATAEPEIAPDALRKDRWEMFFKPKFIGKKAPPIEATVPSL